MKNKRWQNIALGLAFAIPVIGVYVGKRLLSRKHKKPGEILPEVTRIRIPITSLIGIHDDGTATQTEQSMIVLPEDNVDSTSQVQISSPQASNVNYIASIERGKFHKPDCRWAQNIKAENRLVFEDRSSALERDYTPCNTCNP